MIISLVITETPRVVQVIFRSHRNNPTTALSAVYCIYVLCGLQRQLSQYHASKPSNRSVLTSPYLSSVSFTFVVHLRFNPLPGIFNRQKTKVLLLSSSTFVWQEGSSKFRSATLLRTPQRCVNAQLIQQTGDQICLWKKDQIKLVKATQNPNQR